MSNNNTLNCQRLAPLPDLILINIISYFLIHYDNVHIRQFNNLFKFITGCFDTSNQFSSKRNKNLAYGINGSREINRFINIVPISKRTKNTNDIIGVICIFSKTERKIMFQ